MTLPSSTTDPSNYPTAIGAAQAADEQMHTGGHETVDPEKWVELGVLFMGHYSGICKGVTKRVFPSDFATEAMRTCGPSTAAAAEDATKRGLNHLYYKQIQTVHVFQREVGRRDRQQLPSAVSWKPLDLCRLQTLSP